MRARHASIALIYNKTDITADVAGDVESFSYTDKATEASDLFDATLMCIDGKWLNSWRPEKGARVQGTIYVHDWNSEGDNRQLYCGDFLLDDLSYSGEPRTMQIGGVSAPLNESFSATKRTQTWESVTVEQIASNIAGRSGLALQYYGDRITVAVEEQDDTDSSFITKLAKKYGLSVKVYSSTLVLFDREARKRGAAVRTIQKTEVSSWSWNTTMEGTYTGGQLDYTDSNKDTDLHVQIGSGSRWLKLNQPASSVPDGALQLAAALNDANHSITGASITMMGDPGFVAGQVVALAGFGTAIDGRYYVDEAAHEVSSNGYKTTLKLSLCVDPFYASDATGYEIPNPSQHDVYGEDYKSTYEPPKTPATGSTGKTGNSAKGGKGGQAVNLKNAPLYYTSVSPKPVRTISGTYYLYDGINVAGRYRITRPASLCGKQPVGKNVTGWVPAAYI